MSEIVLTHDGSEITLPLDVVKEKVEAQGLTVVSKKELESNYVSRESLADNYMLKTEMDRRFKNWVPKSDAHDDEEIIARVIDKHGKKGPDIEEAKKTWETATLAPLRDKYNSLTNRLVGSEIRAEASEHFREEYTKPAPNGAPSYMENVLHNDFQYSDEYGYTVAVQNGIPIPSTNPTASRPYRSVTEHMAVLAESESWKGFLKPPAKGGGGSGRPGDNVPQSKGFDIKTASESELAAAIRSGTISPADLL